MSSIFDDLCEQLLMQSDELKSYIHSAPFRYKRYFIPKRNSLEMRLIAHPTKTVKNLQRYVVTKLEVKLPIHNSAMAYCRGRGIKENAACHKNSKYLLKMDLRGFFDSIRPDTLFRIFEQHEIEIPEDDRFLLSNLLFWKLQRNSPLRLSVGAPSSPFVSNAIMYFFDVQLHKMCTERNIAYTRYADDMTFSTNQSNVLFQLEKDVAKCLRQHFGRSLRINSEKTIHSSKKHNRHVTGVTLTNDRKLSIGRDRKRNIRAAVHAYTQGKLTIDKAMRLKGLLGFAKHIEPIFIERLITKYGKNIIDELQNINP